MDGCRIHRARRVLCAAVVRPLDTPLKLLLFATEKHSSCCFNNSKVFKDLHLKTIPRIWL